MMFFNLKKKLSGLNIFEDIIDDYTPDSNRQSHDIHDQKSKIDHTGLFKIPKYLETVT